MSSKSSKVYTLTTYLSVFPILILISNKCYRTKEILVALSISLAISRIGCYYASCCSGKITSPNNILAIQYRNSLINKKNNKKLVSVYPTIFLEIAIQFFIAFIVFKSNYAIVWFGILNALLIKLTSYWRLNSRNDNLAVPISSLLFVSLYGYLKCGRIKNYKLKLNTLTYMYFISILFGIITSNDINVNLIKDLYNKT